MRVLQREGHVRRAVLGQSQRVLLPVRLDPGPDHEDGRLGQLRVQTPADVAGLGNIREKFEAFGWATLEIKDGNDMDEVIAGINNAK